MTGGSSSTDAHREDAARREAPHCAVLTVSDSRTLDTDESGALIERLLVEAGYPVVARELVPNDGGAILAFLRAAIDHDEIDAIFCTGGTGLGSRDLTVDVVRPMLDKELPGFGDLFRMLSYQEQIGSAAMLSRALAGAARGTLVAVMPGSRAACELAMTRLLIPELKHALRELRR